jgi:UDP-N-acetylmuramyl pentapeptide phosphotransferase/UDP-N-acetylglucosamine-1-phosphate transferase
MISGPNLLLAVFALCAMAVALGAWLLLRTGLAYRLALDQPNARSLHVRPTPRCGGLAMVPVIFFVLIAVESGHVAIWAGLLLVSVVSWVDDRRGLSAASRLGAHCAAVVLGVIALAPALAVPTLVVCALLWIWGVNLYNFMDGADLMAGSMAVVGFAAYALALAPVDADLAVVACAISGAGLGFLLFNIPPARMFLGDVGSIPLGYLAGALGFVGWTDGAWPGWFPLVVFSPFVADASITLVRRALRGERVWQAHREHFYQKLIQSGASHARASGAWAVAMVAAAGLALWLRTQPDLTQWLGIGAWFVILCLFAAIIERHWRRQQHGA